MRASRLFEVASYVTLGVIMALLMALSLLDLHLLQQVQRQDAQIDDTYARMAITAQLGAELEEVEGKRTLLSENASSSLDTLLLRQKLTVERGKAVKNADFQRLRHHALLISVIAIVPGMLLFGLMRRSFAVEHDVAGHLASANGHLMLKVDERTAELLAANAALREHSARIQAAREEERLRIARDVHDELGSTLTALKFELAGSLGNVGPDGVRRLQVRRAATELVDHALQSVQDVIAALRPFPIEHLGLYEALRWQSKRFQEHFRIPCHLAIVDGLPSLELAASTVAFRVVEEALTNVARHAEASEVCIAVHMADERLVIAVTDNGRGIGSAELSASRSFGLLGMRERARAAGGELTVAASAGRGTTVLLSLPTGDYEWPLGNSG